MERQISVGIFRQKYVDHLQKWSRIFRSEKTETNLSIWIPTEISGIRLWHTERHPMSHWLAESLKVGTHDGTSPCNKSQGLVVSFELAIFATKSSRRDQN